ncbi:hypothetical protein HOY80DRAFT_888881, partial [Tuber brumale]
RDSRTGAIVAFEAWELGVETDGFHFTGLREVQALTATRHRIVIKLRKVVTIMGV